MGGSFEPVREDAPARDGKNGGSVELDRLLREDAPARDGKNGGSFELDRDRYVFVVRATPGDLPQRKASVRGLPTPAGNLCVTLS